MVDVKCRDIVVGSQRGDVWRNGREKVWAMIVQAHWPLLLLATVALLAGCCSCADLVIEVPGAAGDGGGHYRLDYRPPEGEPKPNFTVPARANTINFQGLPGTQYHFMLYYSNSSGELLTWNQTITTAPEPPTDVSVALGGNRQATVSWRPPPHGDYTGFRFKLAALTPGAPDTAAMLEAPATARELQLRDLLPGGTYSLRALTTLGGKESAAYATTNFTTKPNTPGKFIVWFRNETTLLVLWQPPYPAGAYTHYKVAIKPADARDAELYVEKEGEPPGPAQAAFKGLVPGRAYDISVQTVSERQSSAPTTAQYRTVPLKPSQVRAEAVGERSFTARWSPPTEPCEFDRYQVTLSPEEGSGHRRPPAAVLARDRLEHTFDTLEPGAHYTLTLKTMSGKVSSWPANLDVALKPLPVRDVEVRRPEEGTAIVLSWKPQEGSSQDSYQVTYADEAGEGGSITTSNTEATLDTLLPGRNFTLAVTAVSRSVHSQRRTINALTRPAPADSLDARPAGDDALRLTWTAPATPQQWQLRWGRTQQEDDGRIELEGAARTHQLPALRPGAVYSVTLKARALGLLSAARRLTTALPPLPPVSITVSRASSDSALVRWEGPGARSELTGYVLRYRTREAAWTALPRLSANTSEAEVVDMTPGERYTVQVDTVVSLPDGGQVESGRPLRADHATNPSPVSDVVALVDTSNLTLEWSRPSGRVDKYSVSWWEAGGEGGRGQLAVRSASAQVGGLLPGRKYGLAIAALSYNLSSDVFTMETRTRPLIRSEMNIVSEADDENATRAFMVVFTPTPLSATVFDTYRFTLEGESRPGSIPTVAQERTVAANSSERRVRFTSLVPGRLYNITMATLSHNVSSHPVQRQARQTPLPVVELRVLEVESHAVTLDWNAPHGDVGDYLVEYLQRDVLRQIAANAPPLTLADLSPDTEYTMSVSARAGTSTALPARSAPASLSLRTSESPPAAPLRFRPTDARPTSVAFSWSLPADLRHGRLLRFELRHWPPDAGATPVTDSFPPDAEAGEVRGLRAGGRYVFELRGVTGAGAGAPVTWEGALPLGPPPAAPHAAPSAGPRASTALSVRFRGDAFLHDNGNVSAYTLVVAEDPSLPASARALPSWRDVQHYDVWPPYQVTEPYFPFSARDVEEFTIGAERCERVRRPYCNGPLKPSTTYHIKLRAFTAPDKFTDTEYITITTESDGAAWAAGGAAAGALLLLGAGAGAALWRRKKRTSPVATPRLSRPVPAERFAEHYRAMAADSDFRFSEEFEELKCVGREQPCLAAELPCNRPKNRFTNILPYDHSRFKLRPADDEEGSDYINANYVPGHFSPREFIVTQGPLHGTRDDFWRMVWESGCRAIVMLTRCVEKGREKCDRYWPTDTRPALYGEIEVTALTESRYPDWTASEFLVARGGEQRRVQHWHFTTWPDFGVPEPPSALLRFVRAFRAAVGGVRPVVVHCSAGVGRSGTFVVLDRVLQQLAARQPLDVLGAVAAARRERAWLVQTEQQYSCVHQCLLAALDPRDEPPPPPLQHNNQAFEGADDEPH